MDKVIVFSGDTGSFKLFSPSHIAALAVVSFAGLFIFLFRRKLHDGKYNNYFRYCLGVFMILIEISNHVRFIATESWDFRFNLPLHLCDVAFYLSIIMLFSKSFSLFEVVYFWGLGGATQALLTPDIVDFAFPHFVFYQFFFAHGSVVLACLFMVFVERYRPVFRSLVKAFIVTNIYAGFIAVFNLLTGSNYLFLCSKPENPSLMDLLGPWPLYLVSLEFVAVAVFLLLYLPFAVRNTFNRRNTYGKEQGASY